MQYKLGRSIAQLVPFHRIQQQQNKDDSIITNKLIIIMAIVAVVKLSILFLL